MIDILAAVSVGIGIALATYGLGYYALFKPGEEQQEGGNCEVCGGYGMICLNGERFLCWDHYVEECQRVRAEGRAA